MCANRRTSCANSFTAATPSMCASRASSGGVRSTLVEYGLLYVMTGSPTSATAVKWATTSSSVGACDVGGRHMTARHPASLACWAHRMASAALLPETPGITSPRLPTVSTAATTSADRSSSVRVSYSPSDPFGTIPRTP